MLSSDVACGRKGHRFAASSETISITSPSSEAGRSGRGSRKSSKSAALNTSIPPPVAAKEVIALARPGSFNPLREILPFLLGLLREQIVGDAQGYFAALVQFFNDRVVLRRE